MKTALLSVVLLPFWAFGLTCPVDELASFTWGNPDASEFVRVDADQSLVSKTTAHFSGNVIAKRRQEIFHAQSIDYNRESGDIKSDGEITYGTLDFAVRAKDADYSLQATNGNFTAVDYYLSKNQVIGSAETLKVDRTQNVEDLTKATYTTCPRLDPSWFIKAKELHLDHNNGIGQAWGTTFHIGKTPILYLPYFSFPLNDDRKTGFLLPKVNLSETRGFDITQPFYINIDPNQDATLYPRLMSKRGLMLGAEYRYLLAELSGTVSGNLLPNDFHTNERRWSFKTTHRYQPLDNLLITGSYQRVSDKNYLSNFEDTLDLSNTNFLESHLKVSYRPNNNYYILGQVRDYQIANSDYDDDDKPYSVLPNIMGQGKWQFDKLTLSSTTDLTNFDKDNTVSGIRFDQALTASYLFESSYAFVEPQLSYRFSHYELRNNEDDYPNQITRSIPTFSIDSGLFFERQSQWLGKQATQTLEPRLFYLYTPYRNQSDIPDFDTAKVASSYDALFLTNRFSGKDRIGDANQLTTAVSTRFIDNNSGKELAKLSVGQIQYFEDRRVSLSDAISSESRSDIIVEGEAAVSNSLKLRGLLHYDIDTNHSEKSLFSVTYSPKTDNVFTLSHLYDNDSSDPYKQIDFAGAWRFNDNWRTFWRWNYSLKYSKPIDIIAGIEYADCCWGVRLLARQHRSDLTSNDAAENSIYLEFALKGLGNIGSDTTTLLSDIIPYYRPISYEEN